MHIIVKLSKVSKQGNDAFVQYLQESCDAMCALLKKNVFSPDGQKKLKKLMEGKNET